MRTLSTCGNPRNHEHIRFVYGTLRAGEINDLERTASDRGLPAVRRVGAASVPGRLVDFGAWPGLIPVADGRRVPGDIYQVEPAHIQLMDEIEDYHPGRPGCFLRRDVLARLAQPGPDGAELPCQYYPIDPARRGAASDIEAVDHVTDWVVYRHAGTLARRPCPRRRERVRHP